jgi:hypothetical protein
MREKRGGGGEENIEPLGEGAIILRSVENPLCVLHRSLARLVQDP